jgi:meso-butanediol dehydrogenase / (S,S)-butanediol dehydrogenase / diacetyl reductase
MSESRVVLVTGAARGIGRGIAKSFLEAGHRVMVADLGDGSDWRHSLSTSAELDATVGELSAFGEVRGVPVDVTDADSCRAAVKATIDAFGGLDVLANNAGVVDSGPIESFSEVQWDRIFDVNVKGIFNMTAAAIGDLRASGDAAIVNTASIAGKLGAANMSAYCGSKWAAIGITKSLAKEFAPDRIRVNALCPGIVGTAMWLDHLMEGQGDEAFQTSMEERIPLGRPQTTEDMGQAAVYLATAPNVTGVALSVAGGIDQ